MFKITRLIDRRLRRFIIVGIINTFIGGGIMFGLYNIAQYSYWISSAANYVLTSVLSFILNKYYTFERKDWSWNQVIRFALNILVCYFIAYGIAKPLVIHMMNGFSETVQTNTAMFTGMILFTGLNYLGQRLFAFRD